MNLGVYLENELSAMTRFLALFFIVFLGTYQTAFAKGKFVILKYKVEKSESLAKVISRFVMPDSVIRKNTPMVQKIFKANPHIKNWKKISKNTRVKLYISKKFLDQKKLDSYLEEQKRIRLLKKEKLKQRKNKPKPKHYSVGTQLGIVSIEGENDKTLDMNLLKFSFRYTNKLSSNYRYNLTLAGVKFSSINSSEAEESVETKSFLPEFSLGVSRSFSEKFSLGLNYDLLNYFVVSQSSNEFINISPQNINRISLKPYYSLSKTFGLISSLGIITGEISGYDLSLGSDYKFGKESQYVLAVIAYMSSLDVEDSKEGSSAYIASFGYWF